MRRNPRELQFLHRKMGRRTLLVGGIQAALVGGLALRMRHLQVDQADWYLLYFHNIADRTSR